MKKPLLLALALALAASVAGVRQANATSVIGDDYPTSIAHCHHLNGSGDFSCNLANSRQDTLLDPWQFDNRECTSFVAWRLNHVNGVAFNDNYKNVHWGDASHWNSAAHSAGLTVNGRPKPGAVAWSSGHVAWVSDVRSDGSVDVEEYNEHPKNPGRWDTRHVAASTFNYIHVDDLSGSGPGDDTGVASPDSSHVYYVDTHNRIANAWHTASGWHTAAIGGSVRAGTGVASPDSSHVYYVDTHNRVANAWHTASGWHTAAIGGSVRAGTGIASPDSSHVYYVDTHNRVANAWHPTGSGWHTAAIGGSVRAGTGIASPDSSHVYYVDTSNRVANAWHPTGSGWHTAAIGGSVR